MNERNTTMTDHTSQRSSGRPSYDGFAWKSGLLGVSLGAVLLGWGLLARQGAAENAAAVTVSQRISPPVRSIVVRELAPAHSRASSAEVLLIDPNLVAVQAASPAVIDLPPLPQRPIFQQPVTRTRSS